MSNPSPSDQSPSDPKGLSDAEITEQADTILRTAINQAKQNILQEDKKAAENMSTYILRLSGREHSYLLEALRAMARQPCHPEACGEI